MPFTRIDYPAGDGARFASALGKAQNLKDTQEPPQPRNATAAECKAWLIGRAWQLINDIEGRDGEAARGPFVVPPVDMT